MLSLALLVDARPEDVTEARRSFPVEIAAGSLGDPPDQQAHLADLTLDRAKRIAELGGDAVLLIAWQRLREALPGVRLT